MDERTWLAQQFQEHRPHLRAVAYRMLGSTTEADDALQEAWIRLSRSNASEIDNLQAWLVTVVSHVALNMLRSRTRRREQPLLLDAHLLPDPIVVERAQEGIDDPEHEALLSDSVGLALLVVLERLTPAERLAYVLHDMFSVPFEQIGAILERSPEAARQLASRARRRIRSAHTTPHHHHADASAHHQQQAEEVVEAFLAAARDGDFDALLAVLDPDIVERVDTGSGTIIEVRGAHNVARRAMAAGSQRDGLDGRPALINGAAGWVSVLEGELYAIAALTVHNGRITTMDILLDPARLTRLDLTDYYFDS
jgi:RNA polymerase sigma factor (sigma-70 family)